MREMVELVSGYNTIAMENLTASIEWNYSPKGERPENGHNMLPLTTIPRNGTKNKSN